MDLLSERRTPLSHAAARRHFLSAAVAGIRRKQQIVPEDGCRSFSKIIGSSVELHVVLKGSTEEADALAQLSAAKQVREEDTPASPAREAAPGRKAVLRDGYQLVTEKDIKAPDRDDPSFKEALKILPDCDIYEKVTE